MPTGNIVTCWRLMCDLLSAHAIVAVEVPFTFSFVNSLERLATRSLRCLSLVLLGLFGGLGAAYAQFTKTIQVTPGVQVNAVTTWYFSNCTTLLGVGTYAINVAPSHGELSFGELSGPIPGCPTGSPSLPAAVAYYTWTDSSTTATSDFFELYFEINGQVGEVIDVTVDLMSSPPPPQCSITSQTLVHVPGTEDNRQRIGVGEFVLLTNGGGNANWSITSGDGTVSAVSGQSCTSDPGITTASGTTVCYSAPYTGETDIEITASLADGSTCSIPFTTVEPSGMQFYSYLPDADYIPYGFEHFFGGYNMQRWIAAFVTPGDVSFANIDVTELDTPNPSVDHLLHTSGLGPACLASGDQCLSAEPQPPGTSTGWFIGCDLNLDHGPTSLLSHK